MISRRDLPARVVERALREDVVEKDYVLGWVLAGIGTEPALRDGWAFKGGTCLRLGYAVALEGTTTPEQQPSRLPQYPTTRGDTAR